jgi:hypothetical protein
MHRRLKGLLILAAAAVLLHAGPVAACVCADAPAPAMPCCPDEPQGSTHGDHGLATTERYSACEVSAAELLVGSSPELPAPIWIAAEGPPLWTHGPPVAQTAARPAAYESPPIYLVTLRLRN